MYMCFSSQFSIIDTFVWMLYQWLWLVPICVLCYLVSMAWYQDLADTTYKYLKGINKSSSLTKTVSYAAYAGLVWLFTFLIVQVLGIVAPLGVSYCRYIMELIFAGVEAQFNRSGTLFIVTI